MIDNDWVDPRRAEHIEVHELVEQSADIYYAGNDIRAEDLAKVAYPHQRPRTLLVHEVRVRAGSWVGRYNEYRLVNVGASNYMLNSVVDGNRHSDKVYHISQPINLDKLDRLLEDGMSIIDTWSEDV